MPVIVILLSAVFVTTTLGELATESFMGPISNEINRDRIKQEPTHFILASKVLRPGQVYRIIAIIYRSINPITVRASIHRDDVELAYVSQECKKGKPETLLLKIPPTSTNGRYKLHIEGNINGVLGGTVFMNETYLEFSQRSMTIFIQTDRPIYKQGQTISFRAIPIATNLKAFSDAVDVFMLDPRGTVMKRWLSRQTNLGAVSLSYPLSQQPMYGDWTIRVVAQGQIEDKTVYVEEYYQTPFEVNVTMPAFFLDGDDYIYGQVEANYTSGVAVTGNMTLEVFITPHQATQVTSFTFKQFYVRFDGIKTFKVPMCHFRRQLPKLNKSKITAHAYVGEHYLNRIEEGFSQSIIYKSDIHLKFLGSSPQVFKPAMPFKVYLAVSFHDGSALPAWRLSNKQVEIRSLVTFNGEKEKHHHVNYEQMSPSQLGVWHTTIDLDTHLEGKNLNNVYSLELEASYKDDTGEVAKAKLLVYSSYAPTNHHIHVSTSTKHPKVGEYIIFHVRTDYHPQKFAYVILSKGIILLSGSQDMLSTITTFDITVSAEMSPTATIVVYDVAREGEVVADSITFPVDGISRNNFSVMLNGRKDKTRSTVEVVIQGRPGTYIGLSAVDRALYNMHTGNELTYAEVLEKMNTFDESLNGTFSHRWYSNIGRPGKIVHFPSASYGIDTNQTFEYAGLIVFTDANVTRRPEHCDAAQGYASCMDGSCYLLEKRCDEHMDCRDGSDESGCPPQNVLDLAKFRLRRFNRVQRLYDNSWLWKDINIGPLGHYIFTVPVPSISTNWILSAFGMNNNNGFGVLSKVIEISSLRPFYMTVEMPSKSIQGEQIGIRINIFNYMHTEIEVLVSLGSSPDYRFVHVEEHGIVQSYIPRNSEGEHQHIVFVKPRKSVVVYMPIVPTRLGDVNVTVMAKTQVAKDMVTKTILVEASGIPQHRHTSFLLDLSQGAHLIKYLDTNLTESPVVPYRKDHLYVFGSNHATVSIVGDVVGPMFPTMPVNVTSLLKMPSWCGEQNMFNFAANLYSLWYLRLTGQRQAEIEKKAFYFMNIGYQRQLSYQNNDGSFNLFRWNTAGSVWLTAFCVRIFHKATFQEWENFLYIDPAVIIKATKWLLQHQSPEGAFWETSLFPYDRKMNLTSDWRHDNVKLRNISLTAHVLITLVEVKDLSGDIGTQVSIARGKAQQYLERKLSLLNNFHDPYEFAIVAYALTICNSIDGQEAFNKLDSRMKETSGLKYWAKESVLPLKTTVQNNRPYILPRSSQKYDASNVETTAYGLLVHVTRQAVIQKEIVEWLNTQRTTDGGWASTQDTIIAMQALIEYTVRSRMRDITDVSMTIEAPSSGRFVKQLHVGDHNMAQLQSIEIPNPWGSVIIKAQGSGLAIVQLSVKYNVDRLHLLIQPPTHSFLLDTKAKFYGRNNSQLTITSCQNWIYTSESPNSGMAVLEVTVPTGYIITQKDLNTYVRSGTARNLREARFSQRKVTFYFSYLDTSPICVSFTVHRWHPVANMTRYLPVKIYEYYAPEHFNETMIDAFNLHTMNICHVCGSFQCPPCPVCNWCSKASSYTLLQFTCVILVTFFSFLRHQ